MFVVPVDDLLSTTGEIEHRGFDPAEPVTQSGQGVAFRDRAACLHRIDTATTVLAQVVLRDRLDVHPAQLIVLDRDPREESGFARDVDEEARSQNDRQPHYL